MTVPEDEQHRLEPYSVSGKTAVITGAGSGQITQHFHYCQKADCVLARHKSRLCSPSALQEL
jgi:hypothetical protein